MLSTGFFLASNICIFVTNLGTYQILIYMKNEAMRNSGMVLRFKLSLKGTGQLTVYVAQTCPSFHVIKKPFQFAGRVWGSWFSRVPHDARVGGSSSSGSEYY